MSVFEIFRKNRLVDTAGGPKEATGDNTVMNNPSFGNEEKSLSDDEEYEVVEMEIKPAKIICPDCGGITIEGLEFCDKCGGEL